VSAADKSANRQRALNVRNSLFNGAILMFILRGGAHILAFIYTSNLTEESASPSVHRLSAIHVLTKISVKLPIQRAIAPQARHH